MTPSRSSGIPYRTLPGMIRHVFNTYRNSHAFNYRVEGEWRHMSTEVFLERVRRMALGLRALGLKKGDCVGLLAKPSPYWLIADLAISAAGGSSVPLFTHISSEHFLFQISDADIKMIFVIEAENWALVGENRNLFKKIITRNVPAEGERIIDWGHVLELGDTLSEQDPELYATMVSEVTEQDVATVIYTSGSTGIPKGVLLTHENFVSQLHASRVRFPLDARADRALSALPLAHVFERTLMYYYISVGVTVYFCDDIKNVAWFYQDVKPTMTAVVPRLLEKIQAAMEQKILQAPAVKQRIARWAFDLAESDSDSAWTRSQRPLADKLVYSKLREALGGRFRAVISGGASLPEKLCRFFCNIGMPVYQGYGLTETSPVLACNFPGHNRCGTVGIPFPGVEVGIGKSGEVIARGPNIMKGYNGRPEATAQVLDAAGWFHTGDTGAIDADGYVTITGRLKEIFKTSSGAMVSPVPIEQAICKHPLIDMAMVVAEGKPFVSCLFFPDFEYLEALKVKTHEAGITDAEFLDSPYVRQLMNELLDKVNHPLNRWEKVRKFRWVIRPLSITGGELTPTLKIRRKAVMEKYAALIEGMYEGTEERPPGDAEESRDKVTVEEMQ
ncbi:MAG: long-chain fatty acid--CoA ligase [Chlamydiia bacterium]|nr:long-chain fatty acid--CoA ligase [Chlamydiia bacterium]